MNTNELKEGDVVVFEEGDIIKTKTPKNVEEGDFTLVENTTAIEKVDYLMNKSYIITEIKEKTCMGTPYDSPEVYREIKARSVDRKHEVEFTTNNLYGINDIKVVGKAKMDWVL